MGVILLVDPQPGESTILDGLGDRVLLGSSDLPALQDSEVDPIDLIVIGSSADAPVRVLQESCRAHPHAGAVLLVPLPSAEEVRRAVAYAPGIPATVRLLAVPDAGLRLEVENALRDAVDARRHRALLAAVAARMNDAPVAAAAPRASLGTLLDHAPLGVLVTAADGRLVTWNRRAGDMLSLPADSAGQLLAGLFPEPEPVDMVLSQAGGGAMGQAPVALDVAGPFEAAFELSAVATQLDDGRPAVLVLLLDVTSRRAAERTRDILASQLEVLAGVSQALGDTLDTEEALRRLAEYVVPALADWVVVNMTATSGAVRRVAVHHPDPSMREVVLRIQDRQAYAAADRAPSMRAARGEGPVLLTQLSAESLPDYVDDPELRALYGELGVVSALSVPIPGRSSILGSMVLVNGPTGGALGEEDLRMAIEVGRRAGVALENANLYGAQRHLAEEFQRSLLTEPPQPDHGHIVVRYKSAAHEAQVGGDWYDAFVQPDGSTVLVIGDVVGHDTRAAAAMGQLRALLRGIAYTTEDGPPGVLRRLDAAIEGLLLATTATAVVARLEQTDDERARGVTRLRWSNAGHPPPMVIHPDGTVMLLASVEADLLLGMDPATAREESMAVLDRGATVLLYTDGLVERRGQSLDEGLTLLRDTLGEVAELTLEELCDEVLARMLPREAEDDVALVAVRLHRQDLARPAEAGPQRVPPEVD